MQKKAHFIGICGVGMSATATLLIENGWVVSGSDTEFYPPASDYVKNLPITLFTEYKKEHIPKDADLIVIGRNAKLSPDTNPEVQAAERSGIPVCSFPEVLKTLVNETDNTIVAGSYGKSTVTALVAHILTEAGKDPSYFVGAFRTDRKPPAHIGKSDTFILEGDEYPTAHWDNKAKFLHLNARDVILTSAKHDHINVYPTQESYREPFIALLSQMPSDGLLVACSDDPDVVAVLSEAKREAVTYGFSESAAWRPQEISYGEETRFTLTKNESAVMTLTTTLLGKHNVENITGAAAYVLERELVAPKELRDAVATFPGLLRRLDKKTADSSVLIYEGFGSSYEKARLGFDAIRTHFPNRRIITVFEPHTFSWRNRDTLHWYDDVFEPADIVFIYKPAEQGAGTHKQLSLDEIIERVKKTKSDVQGFKMPEEGLSLLQSELQPDDVVVLMTSGDLGGLIESIPKLAETTFPQC